MAISNVTAAKAEEELPRMRKRRRCFSMRSFNKSRLQLYDWLITNSYNAFGLDSGLVLANHSAGVVGMKIMRLHVQVYGRWATWTARQTVSLGMFANKLSWLVDIPANAFLSRIFDSFDTESRRERVFYPALS